MFDGKHRHKFASFCILALFKPSVFQRGNYVNKEKHEKAKKKVSGVCHKIYISDRDFH